MSSDRAALKSAFLDAHGLADARREALAVLEETAPSNRADWIVKDVPQAKALLDQIRGRH